MAKLLLPLILVTLGLGGGVGAGLLLKGPEPPSEAMVDCVPSENEVDHALPPPADSTEFVKLHNQFMVPVLEQDVVESLVVLSLSVEVAVGSGEEVYNREPKLRDAFLQVMFDHANAGGFSGNFLSSVGLDTLRGALREVAVSIVGTRVQDVLIVDLVKQDV